MAIDERTTKHTRVVLSRGDYLSTSDNLSRRRRSGDTLPCSPRRTDERTTRHTQILSPGNYFSKSGEDNLSRRRRSGDDLPCSPRRTDEWTTKPHTEILSLRECFSKSDNLSRRRRSGDDLPCLPARQSPEKGDTTPTKSKLRATLDISKLSKSPQLSRLRRQKVIYGEENWAVAELA
jgi:hypothetical protein